MTSRSSRTKHCWIRRVSLYSLWTMTFLLSCVVRVRSGWIANTPVYSRTSRSNTLLSKGRRFLPGPTTTRFLSSNKPPPPSSSSSSLPLGPWNVGDLVQLQLKDGGVNQSPGLIQEVRGSGWYTIQLLETNETIKCRGTQLQVAADTSSSFDTTGTTTTFTKRSPPAVVTTSRPSTMVSTTDHGPVFTIDPGQKPEVTLPTPTIHDLDAALLANNNSNNNANLDQVHNAKDQEYLKQVAHHATYEKWVVFTDLHCSPSSLETCLQVLTQVHDVALSKNAGVLFLGDFWHHRGTLRVDCLNAVLENFKTWQVPMILIPGNHDQVTLGGHNHGLTPFENAYRVGDVAGPLIWSYPTKFRNALFVPHIRDICIMESILQSPTAQKEVSALFVHADVTGAYMNDLIVSTGGIPPSSFPPHKPIYSGHFHKPHTVQSGSRTIQYLGSPYQTSLSEAQQAKSLAVLDGAWQCQEYIPLDIGRKHFKVSNWQELLQLQIMDGENDADMAVSGDGGGMVKAGDRVVVSIPKEETESIPPAVKTHIKELRQAGATVEIREIKNLPKAGMGVVGGGVGSALLQIEDMTPESTWKAFLEQAVNRKSITEHKGEMLLPFGLELVEQVQDEEKIQTDQSSVVTDLQLTSMTLEGFGPFRETVTYPLFNRGLVLLRGTNKDGGSDSNGSGKSSLAMAPLWALTGSMDPRRVADAKVTDIVHDDAKVAKVTIQGSTNGVSFLICRTKTSTKGSLFFQYNDVDLTTQSIKETQMLLEEKLGINPQVLSRTMFHGQHAINELLECTDGKLKDELSLVVPLGLWQDAATLARTKSREAGKSASELNGMITLRSEDVEKLSLRRDRAEEEAETKQKILKKLEMQLEEEKNKVQSSQGGDHTDFSELEKRLEQVKGEAMQISSRYQSIADERDEEIGPLARIFDELKSALPALYERCQIQEREVFAATMKVDSGKEKLEVLEQKWSVDLSSGVPDIFVSPEACPTCLQPVSTDGDGDGDGHSHVDLKELAEKEIDSALQISRAAQAVLEIASDKLAVSKDAHSGRVRTVKDMEEDLSRANARWTEEVSEVEEELATKKEEQAQLSERLSDLARKSQNVSGLQAIEASINTERTAAKYTSEAYLALCDEVKEGGSRLEELKARMDEQNKRGRTMTELAESLGQRGVQTFVLQNVVDALQTVSQIYLDELSDGAQRLELSLDAGDRISRTAYVRGADGGYRERPLSTLSGGQWRRCSLALTFGFAELVSRRGMMRPSMIVLDEPLTHLDRSGRTKVGDVIRKMLQPEVSGLGGLGMSTVLLILQDLAAEEIEEAFDCIDEVVKDGGSSFVNVDERT